MNSQKKHYWLTTAYQSDIKSLKIKSDKAENKDLRNCLTFDSKDEGRKFLIELKTFILSKYPHKLKWLNQDWVDKE